MLKRALLAGCLALLIAGTGWSAEIAFEMPPELQELLPAEPALIVAVSSLDELDLHWRAIADMLDEGDGDRADLATMLGEFMPQFGEFAAPDRPVVMTLGLPPMGGGVQPPFTFIVPLSEAVTQEMIQEIGTQGTVQVSEGGYLAFSMDPDYTPAGTVPDLALGLGDGFLSAALDLEMVIAAYRPMAEMGLGAMANAPAPPDTGAAAGTAPPMDPEEVAAIQDMTRALMDSARRIDLALRIEGEELTLHTGFAAIPGSPLDPGPQPSFESALQLTRLLPGGGDILQAMALDQTRQFGVFREFYRANINKQIAGMPPEQGAAYAAWMESYLDSIDLFANPVAASIAMTDVGMAVNMIMESDDAPGDLARFAALFNGLSAADIGIGLKKMPTGKVAGTEVQSWTIAFDAEKLAQLSADPMNPSLSGTGRLEAEQMISFLRKVTPGINLAAKGDYLILSADPNPANLAHMIQLTSQRRGAANPRIAAAAAKAGPACQQVVTGDLMAILAWVTEWMEELDDEEYAAIEGNPIPFTAAFTIAGAAYGVDWTMDMPAVQHFVQAVQELEARNNLHDDDGEADPD